MRGGYSRAGSGFIQQTSIRVNRVNITLTQGLTKGERSCEPVVITERSQVKATNIRKLMSADEVCEMLSLPSRATLYAQKYRGDPPGSLAIRVGRHLRWDPCDLDAWLEELKAERRSNWKSAAARQPHGSGR
jgi:predicted DNA-binding transcriptional regulator AlpA